MNLYEMFRFRLRMLWFAFTVKPVAGGSPDDDDSKDDDSSADDAKDDVDKDDSALSDAEDDQIDRDDDWKTKARKHERAVRAERKKREAAEQQLKDLEDRDKSDQEKALDQARKEAREAALSEAEKDRRSDRLEVAVTRIASKGLTIKEGDKDKTVRFADPDDALLRIERAIRRGDIDGEDIFDGEGKVNTDALSEELTTILRANSHLAADGKALPAGDADSRKGDPAQKDLESMTPEDHAKRKYAVK